MNTKTFNELLADTHHLERMDLLMERRKRQRNREWLEHALQSAVSVEFSTIPPYLSALWSIKDPMNPVAASIRNVVQEEMLHMALACNMLTALGCIPKINDPKMVPSYPGKIPGGVHPELTVSLSALTVFDQGSEGYPGSLDAFIAIEAPSVGRRPKTPEDDKGFKTIGAFYRAILDAFRTLQPELSTDRQVSGPLAYMVMADLSAVEAAITLIMDQGEGSEATPEVEHTREVEATIALIMDQGEGSEASPEVKHTHELAHYYRFLEIKAGRRYSRVDKKGHVFFEGEPLEFPDVWPMAVVPKGGYLQKDVPANVWTMLNSFDQTFTQLLDRLQSVWEHGDQAALVHAIETMFGLSQQAQSLMKIEIGDGRGNYGPCFRLL